MTRASVELFGETSEADFYTEVLQADDVYDLFQQCDNDGRMSISLGLGGYSSSEDESSHVAEASHTVRSMVHV